MRRQTASTAEVLTGESCRLRLDPFELPARATYQGASCAGTNQISANPMVAIIGPESVMIRRETSAGVPLYTTVPLTAYRGVLLSVRDDHNTTWVSLKLHHPNADLCVPLLYSDDTCDVIADWQSWSRTLKRPLLIENAGGEISEPNVRLGGLIVKPARARRANRFFAERRPQFLCKRRVGGKMPGVVHDGDEIIARSVSA